MIIQKLNLNLIPGGIAKRVKISQYDNNGTYLEITLYNGVNKFTIPTGSKVLIQGTKADKTGFQYECTYSGSVVTAPVTEQMAAFENDVVTELVIESGKEKKGTENFILEVETSALKSDVEISETDIPAIQRLDKLAVELESDMAEVKKAEESATASKNAAATSASNAKTSETNANSSKNAAATSATNAKTSETNAKTSETNANASKNAAATSATNAATSATNAKTSETNAKTSETNAKTSETNAKSSENLAKKWAVGDSGSGQATPSDTNNAYYWARMAASAAGGGLSFLVVDALPTSDISTSTIYLVPSADPKEKNVRDEYLNLTGTTTGWELIGSTKMVLSDYYTKDEVDAITKDVTDYAKGKLSEDYANVYGAKNLIPFPYNEGTHTQNGITWTVKDDGTVTASGTATAFSELTINHRINNPFHFPSNRYLLSGCPSGGSSSTYRISIFKTDGSDASKYIVLGNDFGNGAEFDINSSDDIAVNIGIYTGATVSNLTFKPMLRLASITDDTYVPYVQTNKELQSHTDEALARIGKAGKNLLPYPYQQTTRTINGITFTDNGDGTIKANGTATGFAQFILHDRYNTNDTEFFVKKGSYVLNGCPANGSSSTYRLCSIITKNGTYEYLGRDNGNGDSFTVNEDDYSTDGAYLGVVIEIQSGTVLNNLTFKPMLRLATIEDDTWEPYSPTLEETYKELMKSKVSYEYAGKMGAKNLIPYPYAFETATSRGITFTAKSDGTVSFSGTPNNANASVAGLQTKMFLKAGTYTLSGGDSTYGGTSMFFYSFTGGEYVNYTGKFEGLTISATSDVRCFTTANNNGGTVNNPHGVDRTFTIYSDAYVDIQARTLNNTVTTAISGTIYPMLRLAEDTDNTYQKYAETNYELTQDSLNTRLRMGASGKNLISYPFYETTKTTNGITFTDNGDGTVTVNGTATADARFAITKDFSNLQAGSFYTLTGCPAGGSRSTYELYTQTANNFDTGEGVTFAWNSGITGIAIVVFSGVTMNNLVFKPMLRYASDRDATFTKYVPSVEEIEKKKVSYEHLGIVGAKNLIKYPYNATQTVPGITWTDNGDGTVKANGTATATAYYYLFNGRQNLEKFPIEAGKKYILSLEVSNGTASIYFAHCNKSGTNIGEFAIRNLKDGYNEVEFTAWEDDYSFNILALYISTAYGAMTNCVIKPMIRCAEDTDKTWREYTQTNYELTKAAQTLNSRLGNAGRNLLEYPFPETTKTVSGVTFTDNGNGSITVNGTPTAGVQFRLMTRQNSDLHPLEVGKRYTISGASSGVPTSIQCRDASGILAYANDDGSGGTVTVPSGTTTIFYFIILPANVAINKVTIYPMLRYATDENSTWTPYEPSVEEIGERGSNYYGTCTTAAATKDKVATVSGKFSLRVGAVVAVKFTYTNTYSSTAENPVTINVNNTGAKTVYYNATLAPTGTNNTAYGVANRIHYYMYDGTYWVWISHSVDTNTTYTNAALGQGYGTCSTAAATAEKAVTLASYALVLGGIVSVLFTNAVPANATLNVNTRGAKAIYHRGAAIKANVIAAGSVATFMYDGTRYQLIALI